MERQEKLHVPSPIILDIQGTHFFFLPSVHNSLIYSQSVVDLFQKYSFSKVLVEFPAELDGIYRFALNRFPIPSVIHPSFLKHIPLPLTHPTFILHPGDSIHMASFLAIRENVELYPIDMLIGDPEALSLTIDPNMLPVLDWSTIFENLDLAPHFESGHVKRSIHMAKQVKEFVGEVGNILVIVGLMHFPILFQFLKSEFPELTGFTLSKPMEIPANVPNIDNYETTEPSEFISSDIHPHSFYLVSGSFPFLIGRLMKFVLGEIPHFDMVESFQEMFLVAEKAYREQFDDTISPANYKKMFQFIKNLSWIDRNLFPSLSSIVLATKGMVDDDYAFEVFRTLISYPYFPEEEEGLPIQLRVVPDEESMELLTFAFKRRMKRPILKRIKNFKEFLETNDFDDLDLIPEEAYPGHWKDIWDQFSPFSTVSYPPEDEFIEAYFTHLRKQGERLLQEEKARVEEFKVSMEDGIAWRETIRNLHEGKVFVKKVPKLKEEIGALIVQFVATQDDEFDHHTVLYAEHEKESDISIISTSPGDIIIGPGITRIKLAAVVSVFPPTGYATRIPYGNRDLTSRLLLCAMSMAISKILLLVSPQPPSSHHRQFVESEGFRLLYLPMTNLSKATLHRLRIFHLLAHPDIRDIAREYIGY